MFATTRNVYDNEKPYEGRLSRTDLRGLRAEMLYSTRLRDLSGPAECRARPVG